MNYLQALAARVVKLSKTSRLGDECVCFGRKQHQSFKQSRQSNYKDTLFDIIMYFEEACQYNYFTRLLQADHSQCVIK